MNEIKKFAFVPLIAVLWIGLIFSYNRILLQYLEVFFKAYGGIIEFSLLAFFIFFTTLFYALFITFSQSFKYALPLNIFLALIPFLFLSSSLSLVLMIGFLVVLTLAFFNFQTNLKTYINFKPTDILITPIKMLNTFIILILSIGFYFHTNTLIQTQGFKLPESLIDWAIDLSLKQNNPSVLGEKYLAQIPTLTPEQLELLKQNPQILESYGLNPNNLDQYVQDASPNKPVSPNQNAVSINPSLPTANIKDILKAQISNSLDSIIKPYLFAIPIILAFLFYSLISLVLWLISFFVGPLLMLIFLILEKSGFIIYEKEMREVKKIII